MRNSFETAISHAQTPVYQEIEKIRRTDTEAPEALAAKSDASMDHSSREARH